MQFVQTERVERTATGESAGALRMRGIHLGEVHVLAREYGWSERDILAMSASRRQLYLDTIES